MPFIFNDDKYTHRFCIFYACLELLLLLLLLLLLPAARVTCFF
jgi:hypothetical protein